MSRSIEERVVSMRFDNKQFESAAAVSMSTLDKLKEKLNFKGAAKGLEEITRAADTVSLSGLTKSAEAVEVKFSAMSIAAITAIQRIVDKAITAGAEITKSLTITPVSTGFQEYELKMNSVQTIMASTGESLETVMGYLNELNEYADKTIYSFADMTTNIGKFTNAGVKLEDAVKAIQGISNEAAVSGANANEASRAMYNFAQALSAGYVKLIDWKSIELANMATVEFKTQLLETAAAFGTLTKSADGTYKTLEGDVVAATKNFNETLEQQWLTTDVLVKTLGDYADETTEIGKKAFAAAQDVKTFTQLLDTLKEAAGSGWAETWEIVIGNFEEAKEIWTTASEVIGGMIGAAAEERNNMLRDWKALGGRDSMLRTFGNAWKALLAVITPVRDAIRDVFPPVTGQQLANLTAAVERFTKSLILSEEASYTLKVAIKAFLIPLNVVVQVARIGVSALSALTTIIFSLANAFLSLPSKADAVSGALRKIFGDSRYERAANAVLKITDKVGAGFSILTTRIGGVINSVRGNSMQRVYDAFEKLGDILEPLGDWLLDRIVEGLETVAEFDFQSLIDFGQSGVQFVTDKLSKLLEIASPVTNAVKGFIDQFKMGIDTGDIGNISDAFESVKDSIVNFDIGLSFEKAIEALKTGFESVSDVAGSFMDKLEQVASKIDPVKLMIFAFGVAMTGVAISVSRTVSSMAGILDAVTGTLNGFTGVLSAVQKRLVPSKFQQIAYAIAILAGALVVLSMVDAAKVQQATISVLALMGAMTAMIAVLAALDRFLIKSDDFSDRMQKLGVGLGLMSAAILGLSVAVLAISSLELGEFATGLLGVVTLMTAVTVASIAMAKFAPTLSANSVFLVAFAASIMMVVSSFEKLANANLDGIQENLGNLRTVMFLLMGVAAISSRIKFGAAAGIGLLAVNLLIFVKVLQILGQVDAGSVAQGLAPLIPVMVLVVALSKATSKAAIESAKIGGSILAMSAAVLLLVEAIRQIASVDLGDAAKGTIVIAALFAVFALINTSMKTLNADQKVAKVGLQIMAMSAAILALSLAIKYIGSMDAGVVLKGTTAVLAMMAMFAVIGKVGQAAKGSIGYIVSLTVVVGVLTTALTLFTLIPTDELIASTSALVVMLTSFGVAMKLMSTMKLTKPIQTAIMIGVMIGSLIVAIKMLSDMGVEKAATSVVSLGALILSISAATNLLRTVKFTDAIVSAASMAAMLTMTTMALRALDGFDGADLLSKAASLSSLILAISAAVSGLSYVKTKNIAPGLAAFSAVMAGLSIAIVAIGALMNLPSFADFAQNGIKFISDLSLLTPVLLEFGIISALLGAFGKISVPVLAGAKALAIVVGGLAIAVIALGGLSSIKGFDDVVTNGSRIFSQLGTALGSFIGNVLGSLVGNAISSGAASTADGLTTFAEKIQPFLESVKNIDNKSVSGALDLAKILLAMTGASVVDGIAGILRLKGDLTTVGEDLKEFADPMADFIETIVAVGPENIQMAADISAAFADLLAAIPRSGGAIGFIAGNKDLEKFGEGLADFAEGIVDYWDVISTVTIDQSIVDQSVAAAMAINELVTALPSTGGVFQEWFGEKDLSNFSDQLENFANAIVAYYAIVKEGGIEKSIVTDSASAAESIATLVNNLPSTGGRLQEWFGGKDLSSFATSLEDFGEAISGYYTALVESGFDAQKIKDSIGAIDPLLTVLEKLSAIEEATGTYGSVNLSAFSTQIESLGDAMVDFSENISGIDIAAVQSAVDIVTSLVNGIENQGAKIETSAEDLADIFIEAFDSKTDEFEKSGKNAIQGLIDGMEDKTTALYVAVVDLCQGAIDAANTTFDVHSPSRVFYTIGDYVIQGLANGILDNANTAYSGIMTVGAGIITAIQTKLGIHSPSTVARDEVGRYIVRGIAEGITADMSAEEAAAQKATNIVNAFRDQLDRIDLSMTTIDLENQLWSNLYGGIPEQDTQKQLEATEEKLKLQAEKVAYANAEYKATVQALGENADATKEAYNKFLQEQITLSELSQTLYELQNSSVVNQQTALKQYGEILKADKEVFELMGWTQDQIREYAAKQVGLDPATLTSTTKAEFDSVQDIFDFYMKDVEVVIEQTVSTGVQKATQTASSGGKQIGSNVSSGIADGLNSNTGKISQAAGNISNIINNTLSGGVNFEGSATNVIDGLLDGLNNKITDVGNAGVNLFSAVQNGFDSAAEIHSPSKKMYESGLYLVQGLASGITDNAYLISNAMSSLFLVGETTTGDTQVPLFIQNIIEGLEAQYPYLVTTVGGFLERMLLESVTSKYQQFYDGGYQLSASLVQGMLDSFTTAFRKFETEVHTMLERLEAEVQRRIQSMRSSLSGMASSLGVSYVATYGEPEENPSESRTYSVAREGVGPITDYTPRTSSMLASRIAGRIESSEPVRTMTTNTYNNFTQNNYSPKALSRLELYRQSKNLLAQQKGKVNVK